jgi:anti-sigma factor RsiW
VQADPPFVVTALAAHTTYVPEVRHAVEVKADEAHLIRWLTKRIGADVRAPVLSDHGWKLMGGRLLPDHGLSAAQFMYEDHTGRRLTLYMRKEMGLENTSFRFFERDGFGSFYWIDRPLAYALSGRLSRDELMNLANVVYAKLETQPSKPDPSPK